MGSQTCDDCRWRDGALCRNPEFAGEYEGVVVSVDETCEGWEEGRDSCREEVE